MKKVLLLTMIIIIVASVPAAAAYKCNWSNRFEISSGYNPGNLAPPPPGTPGQQNWLVADNPSYTDEKSLVVTPQAGLPGINAWGNPYVSQGLVEPGPHAANIKDMRTLNANNQTYYKGYAKFWVYDPGFTSTVGVDARVGVYGAQGENNIGKMATAQIQDASSRNPNWWYAQWSYSVGIMDGVTAIAGGAGYTFTQGLPAPRVWGAWSYVMITWVYTYTIPRVPSSGGAGVIKYFVNQSSVSPNLTLNIDSTSTRWAAFHEVQGIFAGSGMTTVANNKPAAFDNFEFHADPMPEPSSLLALGTGLLGLMGLIRRRK